MSVYELMYAKEGGQSECLWRSMSSSPKRYTWPDSRVLKEARVSLTSLPGCQLMYDRGELSSGWELVGEDIEEEMKRKNELNFK